MIYAIITGDLVKSSQVKKTDKSKLMDALKEAFESIRKQEQNIRNEIKTSFDIFRGDSFQGVLASPADALKASLIIRSVIRKNQPAKVEEKWDARLAIGLGKVDHLPKNISEGDGPAFRNSGPVLDALKDDYRLAITTPWEEANAEFGVSCALLDAVIAKWSPLQAEVCWWLLQNKNAKGVAEELEISQAAVHYRVKGAGWFAIEKLLKRYEHIIHHHIKNQKL